MGWKRKLIFSAVSGLALTGCLYAQPATDGAALWEADLDAFLTVLTTEHENPYFHTSKTDFDAAVAAYRAQIAHMDRTDRIVGLARLTALVGDGHTWTPMHRIPSEGFPPGPGFRSLPIRLDLFADGLFIVGAPESQKSLLGARVTAIGGVPAKSAMARMLTLLPGDAVNFSAEMLPEWLMQAELLTALKLADNSNSVDLTIQTLARGGHTVSLEPLNASMHYDWISSRDTGPIGDPDWVTASVRTPVWLERYFEPSRVLLLDGAVYLQVWEIRNGSRTFAEIAAEAVRRAEALAHPALIVDLRMCAGGDGTLNTALIDAITSSSELVKPGRIAVLTSRRTHSAAVMLVSAFEQGTSAVFYGQPTADRPNHFGETNVFITPNSRLPIVYASEYYQTSHPDDDRSFVTPDILIPETFADYAAGSDPVLDAALYDLKE